jgi:uncharacterized protein with PIN domain
MGMKEGPRNAAEFRFYEELNDFLPPTRKKRSFSYRFDGSPSVKDAVEAIGIPHTEVELVVVNGQSVEWGYRLRDGDRVAVYPVFESIDVSPAVRLRQAPLRRIRFIADVHLGKLTRLLRMMGLDTAYRRDCSDAEIIEISLAEHRVILTRDRGILKTGAVTHGYYVRSSVPEEQAREVLARFDLVSEARPFTRCVTCNGTLLPARKEDVVDRLPGRSAVVFDEFFRCGECGKVYWKGSHFDEMKSTVRRLLGNDRLEEEELP